MKKILIIFVLMFSFITFFTSTTFSATDKCTYDVKSGKIEVGDALDTCLEGSKLVKGNDVTVEEGLGEQIRKWTNNISLYLGIFAVLSIVVGSLMLTLSAGEEEKIKKAKDIVMWGMFGFIGIIMASAIIRLVVNIIYSL